MTIGGFERFIQFIVIVGDPNYVVPALALVQRRLIQECRLGILQLSTNVPVQIVLQA